MLPKVVVYNSVSVDGAIKDFDVDVALHYEVITRVGLDALLAGSATAKLGIELFVPTVPPETPSDFQRPQNPDKDAPWWVIPDSRGSLQGLLHVHRRSGYAKDIIVLVSKTTPLTYIDYLVERHYDCIVTGEDKVDYHAAFGELNKRYGIATMATDSGGVLASILLEEGLIDEVWLLVAPEVVGKKAVNLFRTLNGPIKLEFTDCEAIKNHALLRYKVPKKEEKTS
jgi:2,5-diamino-6-(ribosylamino)-4(3H)-pyrimidinone 5'-phosphate reductase